MYWHVIIQDTCKLLYQMKSFAIQSHLDRSWPLELKMPGLISLRRVLISWTFTSVLAKLAICSPSAPENTDSLEAEGCHSIKARIEDRSRSRRTLAIFAFPKMTYLRLLTFFSTCGHLNAKSNKVKTTQPGNNYHLVSNLNAALPRLPHSHPNGFRCRPRRQLTRRTR